MAGAKGYHSYRGKGSKWKVVLAVLLILVILAAGIFILLQRYVVYDEAGIPRLEIPWQEDAPPEKEEEEPPAQLDLVIREPAAPAQPEIRAFTVEQTPLTLEGWYAAREQAPSDGTYNAAVVTVKDSGGHVRFDAESAVQWAREIETDTTAALTEMIRGDTAVEHAVARMSCFHDPRAANRDVDGMGLKNTGGYIFYDGNNGQWLDPGKSAARTYLCDLAKEAAALGFDEILLTEVAYPTEGKLHKIAYGDTAKNVNVMAFLDEMRAALEPYDILISMELPASVVATGQLESAGLVLAEVAPRVDRIYAAASPEEAEGFSAAVAAASETTAFIPVLTAPAGEGSWLLA